MKNQHRRFIAIIGAIATLGGTAAAQPVMVVGTGDPKRGRPGGSSRRRSRRPDRPNGTFLFRQAPNDIGLSTQRPDNPGIEAGRDLGHAG